MLSNVAATDAGPGEFVKFELDKAFFMVLRAERNRLLVVPKGASVRTAISSHVNPSKYARVTAFSCSWGSPANAAETNSRAICCSKILGPAF
jgi:hypothetical protein